MKGGDASGAVGERRHDGSLRHDRKLILRVCCADRMVMDWCEQMCEWVCTRKREGVACFRDGKAMGWYGAARR